MQFTLEISSEITIVETLAGTFTRDNLTLADAPLMSMTCTNNCDDELWIILGNLTFDVRNSFKNRVTNNATNLICKTDA